MKKTFSHLNRRQALKVGVAGSAALATPLFFVSNANAYTNAPTGDTVMLGFNVPQTGAYADEGADELRAYRLAVKHLNEGGGGMLDTLTVGGEASAVAAAGGGILGKKVDFVTGDTQTKRSCACLRSPDDRKRRRDHVWWRLVLWRGDCAAVPGR